RTDEPHGLQRRTIALTHPMVPRFHGSAGSRLLAGLAAIAILLLIGAAASASLVRPVLGAERRSLTTATSAKAIGARATAAAVDPFGGAPAPEDAPAADPAADP